MTLEQEKELAWKMVEEFRELGFQITLAEALEVVRKSNTKR